MGVNEARPSKLNKRAVTGRQITANRPLRSAEVRRASHASSRLDVTARLRSRSIDVGLASARVSRTPSALLPLHRDVPCNHAVPQLLPYCVSDGFDYPIGSGLRPSRWGLTQPDGTEQVPAQHANPKDSPARRDRTGPGAARESEGFARLPSVHDTCLLWPICRRLDGSRCLGSPKFWCCC